MTLNTLYLGLLFATLMQSSLLVAALLFNKKGNKLSNRLLICIIALFSYYMLIKVLCGTNLILDYPHLTQTYRPLPFLIWPAFYFYIKSMINPVFRFHIKDSMHLIPFVLYTLYLLPFFCFYTLYNHSECCVTTRNIFRIYFQILRRKN